MEADVSSLLTNDDMYDNNEDENIKKKKKNYHHHHLNENENKNENNNFNPNSKSNSNPNLKNLSSPSTYVYTTQDMKIIEKIIKYVESESEIKDTTNNNDSFLTVFRAYDYILKQENVNPATDRVLFPFIVAMARANGASWRERFYSTVQSLPHEGLITSTEILNNKISILNNSLTLFETVFLLRRFFHFWVKKTTKIIRSEVHNLQLAENFFVNNNLFKFMKIWKAHFHYYNNTLYLESLNKNNHFLKKTFFNKWKTKLKSLDRSQRVASLFLKRSILSRWEKKLKIYSSFYILLADNLYNHNLTLVFFHKWYVLTCFSRARISPQNQITLRFLKIWLNALKRNKILAKSASEHDKKKTLATIFAAWKDNKQKFLNFSLASEKFSCSLLLKTYFIYWQDALTLHQLYVYAEMKFKRALLLQYFSFWKKKMNRIHLENNHDADIVLANSFYAKNLKKKYFKIIYLSSYEIDFAHRYDTKLVKKKFFLWVVKTRRLNLLFDKALSFDFRHVGSAVIETWREGMEFYAKVESDAWNNIYLKKLLRDNFLFWKYATTRFIAEKSIKNSIKKSILTHTFNKWNKLMHDYAQADDYYNTILQRNILKCLKLRAREVKFITESNSVLLFKVIKTWTLQERCGLLVRVRDRQLLYDILEKWTMRTNNYCSYLSSKSGSFNKELQLNLQHRILSIWKKRLLEECKKTEMADAYSAYVTTHMGFSIWVEKVYVISRLNRIAFEWYANKMKEKVFIFWLTKYERAKYAKMQRLANDFNLLINKQLLMKTFNTFISKWEFIKQNRNIAENFCSDHNDLTLLEKNLQIWMAKSLNISRLDRLSTHLYNEKLLNQIYTKMTNKMETIRQMENEAIKYNDVLNIRIKSKTFRRWSLMMLRIKTMVSQANALSKRFESAEVKKIWSEWMMKYLDIKAANSYNKKDTRLNYKDESDKSFVNPYYSYQNTNIQNGMYSNSKSTISSQSAEESTLIGGSRIDDMDSLKQAKEITMDSRRGTEDNDISSKLNTSQIISTSKKPNLFAKNNTISVGSESLGFSTPTTPTRVKQYVPSSTERWRMLKSTPSLKNNKANRLVPLINRQSKLRQQYNDNEAQNRF